MAQKTYKQIQEEADRMFGKGASKEKFEWRRKQQEASGLEQESKKRGGVAGAYDRNKALVQAAAPVLAGLLIPGAQAGLAGAVTGGLARGLDRPGKGGIGLDVGRAAQGALAGAALGKVGSVVKSGIGGAQAAAGSGSAGAMGRDALTAARGEMGRQFGFGSGAPAATGAEGAPKTGMQRLLGGAKDYAPVIQAGLGAASDVLGQQAERGVAERKLDIEEQLRREEQARRDRLAQLLMPMFQSQVQQYGQQRQG